jgi:hypothetical protein
MIVVLFSKSFGVDYFLLWERLNMLFVLVVLCVFK